MAKTDLLELAQRIIDGHRIQRGDDLSFFLDCDLEELEKGAGWIQKHFRRNHVDLCTIINGRSGRCPENCKYCAQSAHNKTGCEEYPFLPKERIVAEATRNAQAGVNRFAIVTAGRALTGKDFDSAIEAFEEMHRTLKIGLCASMGFLSREQLHRLHQAGVTSYHHNIETSRRNFPNICTTHTYDDKIREIQMVKEEGLCICSGGIIGMGETWEDRLDMAISLAELEVYSIPINALMPIPGSPLEHHPPCRRSKDHGGLWRKGVPFGRKRKHHRRHAHDKRNDDSRRFRNPRTARAFQRGSERFRRFDVRNLKRFGIFLTQKASRTRGLIFFSPRS